MAFYGKVYKLDKEENFEAFAGSFGLPEDKKTSLMNYKPDQKFEKDGDNYTHVLYINGHEKSINFKDGEEFENTLRTETTKNTYNVDGNTITHVLKFGDVVNTIKKVYDGDKMVETISSNKWDGTATRWYSA